MAPLFTVISPAMGNFSGLVVLLPCVPAVYPHCKLLWQYQPLTVRASPGWPLSCPCSSEQLLPDPQASDWLLGSSCVKHVYTCGRHRPYKWGRMTNTYVSSEMIRTFPLDIAGRVCDQLIHVLMWDMYASEYTHHNFYWNTISVIIHVSIDTDRLLDIRTIIIS